MGKNYCKIERKWCKFCKHSKCFWNTSGCVLKNIKRCPKRESTRTIRLKDYLINIDINEVMEEMEKHWPDQIKSKSGYASVLNQLQSMKAEKTDWFIDIKQFTEPAHTSFGKFIDEYSYLIVSGIAPNKQTFAIEYVPWANWLGMNISTNTLSNFNKNTIIAAILYEMTWAGFNEKEIKDDHEELLSRYESMITNN